MFEARDQDFIAWLDAWARKRGGHKVDGLRGAAHEDDFLRRPGVDEATHAFTSSLEGIRGSLAQRMDTAMDIRMVAFVVVRHRVDDDLRMLAGRCVVRAGVALTPGGLARFFVAADVGAVASASAE